MVAFGTVLPAFDNEYAGECEFFCGRWMEDDSDVNSRSVKSRVRLNCAKGLEFNLALAAGERARCAMSSAGENGLVM